MRVDKRTIVTEGREEITAKRYSEIRDIIIKNSKVPFKEAIKLIAQIDVGTYYNYTSQKSPKYGRISLYTAKNMSDFFKLPMSIFDCTGEFTDDAKAVIAEKIKEIFSTNLVKDKKGLIVSSKVEQIAQQNNLQKADVITSLLEERFLYPFISNAHAKNYFSLINKYYRQDMVYKERIKAFFYIIASNGLYMEYLQEDFFKYDIESIDMEDRDTRKTHYLTIKIPKELMWTVNRRGALYGGRSIDCKNLDKEKYDINIIQGNSLLEYGMNFLFYSFKFFIYDHYDDEFNNFYCDETERNVLGNSISLALKDEDLNYEDYSFLLDNEEKKVYKTLKEYLESNSFNVYTQNIKDVIKLLLEKIEFISKYYITVNNENTIVLSLDSEKKQILAILCVYNNGVRIYDIGDYSSTELFYDNYFHSEKEIRKIHENKKKGKKKGDSDYNSIWFLEPILERYEALKNNEDASGYFEYKVDFYTEMHSLQIWEL